MPAKAIFIILASWLVTSVLGNGRCK